MLSRLTRLVSLGACAAEAFGTNSVMNGLSAVADDCLYDVIDDSAEFLGFDYEHNDAGELVEETRSAGVPPPGPTPTTPSANWNP